MKWKYLAGSVGLIAALALAGCGDDNSGGNNGGGNNGGSSGPATFSEFQTETQDDFIELLCTAVYDCPEKQSPIYAVFFGRFSDKQACLAGAEEVFDMEDSSREMGAIEDGRLVYDADAARSCLQTIAGLGSSCVAISDIQPIVEGGDCADVLTAQQEEGDPCLADDECTTGACDFGATSACYGTCVAVTPAAEGETCGEKPCAEGLVCAGGGQPEDPSTCVPRGSRSEGEPCEAAMGMCSSGLVCGFDGTCVTEVTYVGSGQTCNQSGQACEPGLVCADLQQTADGFEGTCGAPRAQGESCVQEFQCEIGLYCDSETSTCEAPKPAGEPCPSYSSSECEGDLTCDSSGDSPVCAQETSDECEIPSDGGSDADAGTDTNADAG